MQKPFLIFSVVIFAGVLLFTGYLKFFSKPMDQLVQNMAAENTIEVPVSGITVFAPKEHEAIESPLKVRGMVKGNGWIGFEGQVGTVKLQDMQGKELAAGILTATSDWMQSNIYFETTLAFTKNGVTEGRLIFHNENPSGEPERDQLYFVNVNLK